MKSLPGGSCFVELQLRFSGEGSSQVSTLLLTICFLLDTLSRSVALAIWDTKFGKPGNLRRPTGHWENPLLRTSPVVGVAEVCSAIRRASELQNPMRFKIENRETFPQAGLVLQPHWAGSRRRLRPRPL